MCPNVELKGPSDPAKQLKIIDFSEPGSFEISSKDVNGSLESAAALADYLEGLRVNLIPYDEQKKSRFSAPEEVT